jgi:hypothetical protein
MSSFASTCSARFLTSHRLLAVSAGDLGGAIAVMEARRIYERSIYGYSTSRIDAFMCYEQLLTRVLDSIQVLAKATQTPLP